MRIEEFLTAVLAKCPNGIDYDSMTSEWYPYREWCNPPVRGRFAAFRIDGLDRAFDGKDRNITIWYKYRDKDCPNPPDSVRCISFRTITHLAPDYQSFNELPDEACNEALDKLPPLSPARPPPCGNYGDVNDDGYVTEDDAILVINYYYYGWDSIETPLTEVEFRKRADVVESGEVDLGDALLIKNYAEGLIDTFPICEAPARPPPCGNYGDLDDDGYITQKDADLLAKYYISGWSAVSADTPLSEEEFRARADVSASGEITLYDASLIGMYFNYNIDTFPICEVCPKPSCGFTIT